MQLVVKISEDTFFDLKKKQNRTEVDNAVLNGTPLPKIMTLEDANKRKKELENRLNASVQNLIDQEICKEPSLWWKCERCGKLIPYMADFCHECADELLGDPPKPFDPIESEG